MKKSSYFAQQKNLTKFYLSRVMVFAKKKKFIKFTAISKHLYFVIRNDNQKDQILRFRPKRVATNNS
jgi:hypothetical protein